MKTTVLSKGDRTIGEPFELPVSVQEVTTLGSMECGFRMDWMSGQDEAGNKVEATSGAGLGSPWLLVSYTPVGGESRQARVNITDVVQAIAKRLAEPTDA